MPYTGGGNGGFIFIALKPLGNRCKESATTCDERQTSAMDVINRLRPKMNRLPVASAFLQPAQDLRIGGRGSTALYQYTIQSDNIDDLAHWGPILLQQHEEAARPAGREYRPAERRTAGDAHLRPRRPPRAWAKRRNRSTGRSTAPSGSRRFRSSTRSSTSITW